MKGVFLNKQSGNYFLDYRLPNGKRRRETIGKSKKLAESVMAKRRTEIKEGKYFDIEKKDKIKFEVFAQEFIEVYAKPNKKSWISDLHNLKALNRSFQGKYLYSISNKDIERFKVERLKEVSPATTNRELATLKTMLSKAILWGKLSDNPAKAVKFMREPQGRLRFLEREEITKLLACCNGTIKPIVTLALHTGMRKSEILGLQWRDVDFRRNIITLLDTKNGSKRMLPINETAKNALISVLKHPESPYIFSSKSGQPLSNTCIAKSFLKACKKADIINFKFHDCRHSFCSHLAMSGIDIATIRELAGHKDLRMTLRYSHLSPSHKQRAVDVLNRKMDTFWTPSKKEENFEGMQASEVFENIEVI